jgi:hypothetical protein
MTRAAFLALLLTQTASRRKGAKAMNGASPLEIRVIVTAGPGLRASLANVSSGPLMVLHDRDLQPSRPVFTVPSGHEVRVFDRRSIEKFDTTPYRAMYHKLEPGKELLLWDEKFHREDDGYHFDWGPFEVSGIPPGACSVAIHWKSAITKWVDSETRQSGNWKDVWVGEVASRTVKVELG